VLFLHVVNALKISQTRADDIPDVRWQALKISQTRADDSRCSLAGRNCASFLYRVPRPIQSEACAGIEWLLTIIIHAIFSTSLAVPHLGMGTLCIFMGE
jgi:hypothetical protein